MRFRGRRRKMIHPHTATVDEPLSMKINSEEVEMGEWKSFLRFNNIQIKSWKKLSPGKIGFRLKWADYFTKI